MTGCKKREFWLLLIVPIYLIVTSVVAVAESSEEIKFLNPPVEFNFDRDDISLAKGRCFDLIHKINTLGPDKIMVGSKTFYVDPGLNTSNLHEGMFVGITLNVQQDTIITIEQAEEPDWWGNR